MINIFYRLREQETTGKISLLYEGDCERCFLYWNLSQESRSEGQKTWISGRIHRIGPRSTTHEKFHYIRVEQNDRRDEDALKGCPELEGTGYNNLVACREWSLGPSHLFAVA